MVSWQRKQVITKSKQKLVNKYGVFTENSFSFGHIVLL